MLRDSFYKVISTEQIEAESSPWRVSPLADFKTTLLIDKQHLIFKGHFPGLPVVPGVCMLQMIKELLENRFQKELHLMSAANIKFLSLINPNENEEVDILLKFNESEDGTLTADGVISDKSITYFKINKAVYK